MTAAFMAENDVMFQWRNVQYLVYFSFYEEGHNHIGNSAMNPTWRGVGGFTVTIIMCSGMIIMVL